MISYTPMKNAILFFIPEELVNLPGDILSAEPASERSFNQRLFLRTLNLGEQVNMLVVTSKGK